MKGFYVLFFIVTIVSSSIFMTGMQANAICDSFNNAFGIEKIITVGVVVLLSCIVIFGSIKRIANVAQIATPFMAVVYTIVALVILTLNIQYIPGMFILIISCSFGMKPIAVGIVGSVIIMGVKCGIFSNEAGQGTVPHAAAAAAASVTHPVKQGLAQAFSVYADTLLVCSAMAFMILITGMYKVFNTRRFCKVAGEEGRSTSAGAVGERCSESPLELRYIKVICVSPNCLDFNHATNPRDFEVNS